MGQYMDSSLNYRWNTIEYYVNKTGIYGALFDDFSVW